MQQCSICLDNIYPANYTISCGHTFHKSCIKKWFSINDTCPVCRKKVVNQFMVKTKNNWIFHKFSFVVFLDNRLLILDYNKPVVCYSYEKLNTTLVNKRSIYLSINIDRKNRKVIRFILPNKKSAEEVLLALNSKLKNYSRTIYSRRYYNNYVVDNRY